MPNDIGIGICRTVHNRVATVNQLDNTIGWNPNAFEVEMIVPN